MMRKAKLLSDLTLPSRQMVFHCFSAGIKVYCKCIFSFANTQLLADVKGHFDLVIKSYPNGVVSKYMDGLKEGDRIEVKGPLPKFKYVPNMKKSIGMVAGGTGITPMLQVCDDDTLLSLTADACSVCLCVSCGVDTISPASPHCCTQVIREILKNPHDSTEVHLVYANDQEEDILLKAVLDGLAKTHKNFKVTYVLSKPPAGWNGHKGYVSADILHAAMPKPTLDNWVLVCGPPGMMEAVSGNKTPDYKQGQVSGLLKAAGYTGKPN